MKKVKAYERSPFYYETDRMNVIHHSNYIRWFEEARIYCIDILNPLNSFIAVLIITVSPNLTEFLYSHAADNTGIIIPSDSIFA